MVQIIIIAIILAIDCFSVSFAASSTQKIPRKTVLLIALSFGFAQGLMYSIGSFCNISLMKYICRVDHWVAFSLLLLIGGKMIIEACSSQKEKDFININNPITILILSIATSIDALAVGFSITVGKALFFFSITMVFLASFLFSIIGVKMGKTLANIVHPKYAEIVGGIILILIGSKVLVEHLFFS